ncbi:hypothetical protein JCM10003_878 [Bacteroides pyogenes JCM 10003]|nr:hypothetical protein JCM10003_878 [Bacteroides pyogenes JCM 10003]
MEETVKGLQSTGVIKNIYLMTTDNQPEALPGCKLLNIDKFHSSRTMKPSPKAQMRNIRFFIQRRPDWNWECSLWNE